MEVNDKIQEIKNAKKAYLKLIRTEGKGLIKQLLTNLFTEVPTLEAVRWTQFTPYFNDGDTCTFGVYTPEFKFAKSAQGPEEEDQDRDAADADEYEDDEFIDVYRVTDFPGDIKDKRKILASCKQFAKTLEGLDEVLEIAFGDHVEVHATPKDITTVEYEHE